MDSGCFFNKTAPTVICTLSLHDALPILAAVGGGDEGAALPRPAEDDVARLVAHRSEEHTSELQSHVNVVCRLLLEKTNRQETDSDHPTDQVATAHAYSCPCRISLTVTAR